MDRTRNSKGIFAPRRRVPTAFTLIELLVVISIIALLVAMLLPALQHARTAGQKMVSLSNVRQIGIAVLTYANDNKMSMPWAAPPDNWGIYGETWPSTLVREGKYVNNYRVFWSPKRELPWVHNDNWKPSNRPDGLPLQGLRGFGASGYGLGCGAAGKKETYLDKGWERELPLRLNDAAAPPASHIALLAETWSIQTWTPNGRSGWYRAVPHRRNDGARVHLYNYDGGVVRSYVDGRASAPRLNPQYVYGDEDHAAPGRAAVAPEQLGWQIGVESPTGYYPGPYNGTWNFVTRDDFLKHEPWYMSWQSGWNERLRP